MYTQYVLAFLMNQILKEYIFVKITTAHKNSMRVLTF